MRIKRTLFLMVAGVLLSEWIQAQIVTDRPDQTESAYTVGKGNLQVESGYQIGFEGDGFFSTRRILAPSNLFRYGITRGIELRLLNQFESVKANNREPVRGLSDLEIGAKIQIIQGESTTTRIAFLTHLVTPTGTNGLSGEGYGSISKLAVSHELNEQLDVACNLGYDYFGTGRGNPTYTLTMGIQINKIAGIYVETYGELRNFEEFMLNCDAGLTVLANDHLQFDFSFGTGIMERMNYVSIGGSWLITKETN